MTVIKVNMNIIRSTSNELVKCKLLAENINSDINNMKSGVSATIQSRRSIGQQITNISKRLDEVEHEIESLYNMINESVDRYMETEYQLCRRWSEIGNSTME